MILAASVLSFCFVFFLVLSMVNAAGSHNQKQNAEIEGRLEAVKKMIPSIGLEKEEYLSRLPFLDRFLRKTVYTKKFQNFLSQSGLSLTVGGFFLMSVLSGLTGFLFSGLIKSNLILSLFFFMVGLAIPFLYVLMKRSKRIKYFSDRFPDAIELIAGSLRAGHSLQMAIETVVEDSRDIVAAEFEIVLSQLEVGQSFDDALKGILTRIDLPELRLFVSAVILQRETGGNLAELLDNLESVIRERHEMKRELSAATAQARLSGTVLSLLPVFVGMLVFMIHPPYILFFFQDAAGIKLLILAVTGQMIGVLAVRKIIQIEF